MNKAEYVEEEAENTNVAIVAVEALEEVMLHSKMELTSYISPVTSKMKSDMYCKIIQKK